MGESTDLLILRLGLIGLIFVFVLGVSLTMRMGLHGRSGERTARRVTRGSRLVIIVPGRTGFEVGDELAVAGEMTIGRDPANGIVLADPSVSGFHSVLVSMAGGWMLTDNGSTNGTFVDGRAIDGQGVLLRGGEEISFGKVVARIQR